MLIRALGQLDLRMRYPLEWGSDSDMSGAFAAMHGPDML
jgi:hypothetical protein